MANTFPIVLPCGIIYSVWI